MPTVSVRLSEDEKRRLARYGRLSDSIREAVRLYLNSKDSEKVFAKLRELQRANKVTTTPEEIVRMIREDRTR